MNTPIIDQFTEIQQELVRQMYAQGDTHAEIGEALGKPRRTIMKLCQLLGLKRSKAQAATLKRKSDLDNPSIISTITAMRNTHSLREIATTVGGSVSAVHRLCLKYDIILDNNAYKRSQSSKMVKAWTNEKRLVQSVKSRNLPDHIREKLSASSKALWADPEYRALQVAKQTEYWNRDANKDKS